jgi:hypothetical protein
MKGSSGKLNKADEQARNFAASIPFNRCLYHQDIWFEFQSNAIYAIAFASGRQAIIEDVTQMGATPSANNFSPHPSKTQEMCNKILIGTEVLTFS